MIEAFGAWVEAQVAAMSYGHIVFLMALESSLFPVPSELVMIPAGYLAQQGQLNPWLATLAGGIGSLLGATANYVLGMTVGKAFLQRYGKWFLINPQKYVEAEALFLKNAHSATFIGRFIPVIRHLISLPAGIFRMGYLPFAFLTTLGATIWCGVLVGLGYTLGESTIAIVRGYAHWIGLAAVAALALFILWFLFVKKPASRV